MARLKFILRLKFYFFVLIGVLLGLNGEAKVRRVPAQTVSVDQSNQLKPAENQEQMSSPGAVALASETPQLKEARSLKNQLSVTLGLRYFGFDVREKTFNTRVALNTGLNPAASLAYQMSLSPKIQARAKLSNVFYLISNLPQGYTIQNRSGNLLGVSLEFSTHLKMFQPYFGIESQQEVFFRSPVVQTYQLSQAWIWQPYVGVSYALLKVTGWVVGLGLQGRFLFPGKTGVVEIASGYRFSGSVFVLKQLSTNDRLSFKSQIYYSYGGQSSQFATQSQVRFNFDVGASYSF